MAVNVWTDQNNEQRLAGTLSAQSIGATAASRYAGATASGAPASGTFAVGDFVIAQIGQVLVCTAAGTPGTWATITRSYEDIFRAGLGLVSWNVMPTIAATAAQALTSQTIYAVPVPYRAGDIVTRIGWQVATAAVGTAPTGMYCGISSATTLLMDSGNLASSTGWTTAGFRTVPLSGSYTILADGIYYHLILQNGTFSVTQPSLNRGGTAGANPYQVDNAGAFLVATAGTGQTALPAVNAAVTLAAAGFSFYTFSS